MKKKTKTTLVTLAVVLALSISAVSAQPAQSHALSAATEAASIGGSDTDSNCLKAIGVVGAFAVAGLSPCSILCWGAAGILTGAVIVWCT